MKNEEIAKLIKNTLSYYPGTDMDTVIELIQDYMVITLQIQPVSSKRIESVYKKTV